MSATGPITAGPSPKPAMDESVREVTTPADEILRIRFAPVSLTNTVNGTYVELDLPGDESQLDTLAALAAGLRPVESLPRPPARDICAALRVSIGPITVAGAFDSTADAIARWIETPQTPEGPHRVVHDHRRYAGRPAAEHAPGTGAPPPDAHAPAA